jgi:putative phosphonate metabolism protein
MSARYAIYFAPEKLSPWWLFGAHWLGRDESSGAALPQPLLEGFDPEVLTQLTAQPRRYGFHATLKAPFRLADGCNEATLVTRLETLARTMPPVPLGPLSVQTLSDFIALVPEVMTPDLQSLAARCVTGLDDLRAPLTQDDLLRRQGHRLDEREAELLALFGYPYVMERFRLHLTLSGPMAAGACEGIARAVAAPISRLNGLAPLTLDRLCLFIEPTTGAPFLRIANVMLQGSST